LIRACIAFIASVDQGHAHDPNGPYGCDPAAFVLGLPIPPEWDGVPVYEAFGMPVERQSLPCE
jgi:hypothetical protein